MGDTVLWYTKTGRVHTGHVLNVTRSGILRVQEQHIDRYGNRRDNHNTTRVHRSAARRVSIN